MTHQPGREQLVEAIRLRGEEEMLAHDRRIRPEQAAGVGVRCLVKERRRVTQRHVVRVEHEHLPDRVLGCVRMLESESAA